MIIYSPEIDVQDGQLTISTRVETQRLVPYLPERLWFRFPESYREYISGYSNGFLSSLILIAMHLEEDLEVRGVVSNRLAENLDKVQQAYQEFFPRLFKQVEVRYEHLQAMLPEERGPAVLTAFSGGIDSSYTVWSHLPENQLDQDCRLTHGLFIHGFDFFLHQSSGYQTLYRKYADLFERQGLELLQAATNAYSFSQFRFDWGTAHDPMLAGMAMLLDGLVRRFYKPGSGEMKRGKPSKPTVYSFDLLCTENLEVALDRPDMTRTAKLAAMVDFPFAQEGLRVCMAIQKTPDGTACYHCEKCLNTLVYLEVLGVREKFKNFPRPLTLPAFVRFCWISLGMKKYYVPELPRLFRKYKRYDLYVLFMLMLPLNELKNFIRRKFTAALPPDTRYKLSRMVFTDHLPPNGSNKVKAGS